MTGTRLMYRRFRIPAGGQTRPTLSQHGRSLSLIFGVLVLASLVIAPIAGRVVIPSEAYRRPHDESRRDVWFRPPSIFRADAIDSSLTSAIRGTDSGGRVNVGAVKDAVYDKGDWSHRPLKGAILGTDQVGRNVLWRLVHGSEIVVLKGTLSAVAGLLAGLLWGLAMSWWSPPLFPGNHRVATGWRSVVGWVASRLFELFDLLPRVILLLFIGTIGGITLERLCVAVGLLIALQVASGVRQHANELRRSDPVASAEELGLSPTRIVWGHIVWNHMQGFVLAQFSFAVGAFVLWDATMGYLGYSLPGKNNWGQLIYEGMKHDVPWLTWSASIATVLVVLGLFRLSDGIEHWRGAE